jgi:GTP pyrophosphokinase
MDYNIIFDKLIERVRSYHPAHDLSLIEKAFQFSEKEHGDQRRKSGEPYIIHPLSVAYILANINMDIDAIVAGLLHDVVEDTTITIDVIAKEFGEEVAKLVDGVTTLTEIEINNLRMITPEHMAENQDSILSEKDVALAENYRKMFIAMAKDIRVVIIKVADRLHNLRTLSHMPDANQKAKAKETLDIYAPICHRLGIAQLRYEMEDLSFWYLDPEKYRDLEEKTKQRTERHTESINSIVEQLKAKLEENGLTATVEGRVKHTFSIYKKIVSQNKTIDQLYDFYAIRVIVDTVQQCYEALGVTHGLWRMIDDKFKDFISNPKHNGYQSLHTTVYNANNEPFEVQIRTKDMHRIAEYGIAAHWKYKEGKDGVRTKDNEEAKFEWLRQILDFQKELTNDEYMDSLKGELSIYDEHIYCHTPKGKIISLIKGSTPVDFAFAIHSEIGYKMIGARVNGNMVPYEYVLANNDKVEIITNKNSKGPSKDWLLFVKSSQAKNKIKHWFAMENRVEYIKKGKEALAEDAKNKKFELANLLDEKSMQAILERFGQNDWDSLCSAVGKGGIKEGYVVNRLIEDWQAKNPKEIGIDDIEIAEDNPSKRKKLSGILVKGIGDSNVRFSKCCSPIPGDEVIAFATRGRGISLHREDCTNITNLVHEEKARIIPAEWALPSVRNDGRKYVADIILIGENSTALVANISRILNEDSIPIRRINGRTDSIQAEIELSVEVFDKAQLDRLFGKLKGIRGVDTVERTY